MKLISLVLFFCMTFILSAKDILLTSPDILINGSKYITKKSSVIHLDRFDSDVLKIPKKELGLNPKNAVNNTGMSIVLNTNSKSVIYKFLLKNVNWMGAGFTVFEDGVPVKDFHFKKQFNNKIVEIKVPLKGEKVSEIEISLPSFSSADLLKLSVDDDAVVKPVKQLKKIYVALGDSISHGVGQDGFSSKTWPFLLSKKLNAELFNLAVGGAKVSVPVGKMLSQWKKIDYITILVGYNDIHFDKKSTELYIKKYNELLDAIRKNHKESKIFVITPLFTLKPVEEKTGVSLEDYRSALVKLVKKRQKRDNNIFLIEGNKITSIKNLRKNTKDPVHMSIEGASMFVDKLYKIIKSKLNL